MAIAEKNLPKATEFVTRERREIRKLGTLVEIGRILADTNSLKSALERALEALGRHHGMVRSFVMLLDSESEKIRMEATFGLNLDQARRVTYKVGEGVIGRVVQSGKPVVVPQTSQEPLLLNRLRAIDDNANRREMSFICVPILIDNKAIGVIGADRPYKEERDFDRTTKFLSVIASMIAQALKVQQRFEADKKLLVDENALLKQELRERYDFSRIIGNSNPMRQVYEKVTQFLLTK